MEEAGKDHDREAQDPKQSNEAEIGKQKKDSLIQVNSYEIRPREERQCQADYLIMI